MWQKNKTFSQLVVFFILRISTSPRYIYNNVRLTKSKTILPEIQNLECEKMDDIIARNVS